MVMKLSPARRVVLVAALIGLFFFGISFRSPQRGTTPPVINNAGMRTDRAAAAIRASMPAAARCFDAP